MKTFKVIFLTIAIALIFISASFAQISLDECTSSGLKTDDAAIATGKQLVCGYTLHPDGTNACTLSLYDSASAASGTVLAKGIVAAGTADSAGAVLPFRVKAFNGVYADHTTCGGYIVYTRPQ